MRATSRASFSAAFSSRTASAPSSAWPWLLRKPSGSSTLEARPAARKGGRAPVSGQRGHGTAAGQPSSPPPAYLAGPRLRGACSAWPSHSSADPPAPQHLRRPQWSRSVLWSRAACARRPASQRAGRPHPGRQPRPPPRPAPAAAAIQGSGGVKSIYNAPSIINALPSSATMCLCLRALMSSQRGPGAHPSAPPAPASAGQPVRWPGPRPAAPAGIAVAGGAGRWRRARYRADS